jgi:acyl-CoA reductase-like NAD-dependent aldehyde dehydrogenase
MPPTVLDEVPTTARILREEVFGPVAPITRFTTEEEAIALANATEFGLAAYVFTRDDSRALPVCEALEAGMVGLNQGVVSNPAAPLIGRRSQTVRGRRPGRALALTAPRLAGRATVITADEQPNRGRRTACILAKAARSMAGWSSGRDADHGT